MEEAELDGLLLAGRGILASYGYVVYATGYTPLLRNSYAYIDAGSEPTLWVPSISDEAIVRERGLISDVRSTGESDWTGAAVPMAEAVATDIASRAPTRVGVAGFDAIVPPADEQTFKRVLADIDLVDGTSVAQNAKARKSADELDGVRASAALAREAYDVAPGLLRPGVAAQQVVAELERILRNAGALELIVFVDRGPYVARRFTETVLTAGDLVSVLVEVANTEGYWVEIGGLFSLGAPSQADRALASACYEALDGAAATCRPNVPVAEAAALFDRVAASNQLRTGLGLGHGVGIDHDLPVIAGASESVFETGHVVSIHPNLLTENGDSGAIVADGVIVGASDDEPERISGLESRLTILNV